MTQQTAIEWLEEELAKNLKHIVQNADSDLMESLFEQAKQMEKEQIKDAYLDSSRETCDSYGDNPPHDDPKFAELYYKNTYGQL